MKPNKNSDDLSRRDFSKLSLAAFSGMLMGTMSGPGCATVESEKMAVALLLDEPHVCRGLNTCKGKGKGGKNECAGRGSCAAVDHACHTLNDCKGQGGCEETAGRNSCKGKGNCSVPLDLGAWKKARAAFEKAAAGAALAIGPAPAS